MVKNSVKVYARLRNTNLKEEATVYSIRRKEDYDILTLYKYSKQRNKYKYHQIFDQNSSQEDVFENTTRPILNSVLHGFNGTVFAYGQTGSGKTYSMTGCSDEYQKRGIIPRCIQEMFQFTNKNPDQYTIFISYMEIYNEIGYDLLNPKHQATKLEELPRVTLLDDGKGESHVRNLFMLPVLTEQEAMRLLFLGDTNRTIAETPMNDYSSRSHCIFTMYISKIENERKIRKSKLNLVDLAGSERIYKSNITGTTLTEAKNINLSLHYLEQVILALSQSKRSHIPFRNSLMTYMLRDSLSGNSITVMLATLSIKANHLEETVTTCNFSQRVALVNTDATINEIFDPQEEIDHLRNEVTNLRERMSIPGFISFTIRKELSESEIEFCKMFTEKYLETGIWNNNISINLEQCIKCFQIFRDLIVSKQPNVQRNEDCTLPIDEYAKTKNDIVEKFKEIIEQKDEEIDILTQLLETYDLSKNRNATNNSEVSSNSSRSKQSEEHDIEELELSANEEHLFEEFLKENNNNVQIKNFKAQIESRFESAKQITAFVESCQENILRLRRKLDMGYGITDSKYVTQIQSCLKSQQDVYAKSIDDLKKLKIETDFLDHGLKQERIRLEQTFKQLKKEDSSRHKHSAVKCTSENGIFTKINESIKNMERTFSANVNIQAKSVSPKTSDSKPYISTYQEKQLKANISTENMPYSKKESNSNPHPEKVHIMNSYVEKPFVKSSYENISLERATDNYLSGNTKKVVSKKPIEHHIVTSKKTLPSTSRSSNKWDALKRQQNELYSSYGDPPGNITRLMIPFMNTNTSSDKPKHKSEERSNKNADKTQMDSIAILPDAAVNRNFKKQSNQHTNNNSSIGVVKSTTCSVSKNIEQTNAFNNPLKSDSRNSNESAAASIVQKCKRYDVELGVTTDFLRNSDSDSIFQTKVQSYLKTIGNDPSKDILPANVSNATRKCFFNTPESCDLNNSRDNRQQLNVRPCMKTVRNANVNFDYLQHPSCKDNQMPDNYSSPSSEGKPNELLDVKISKESKNLANANDSRYKNIFHANDIDLSTSINIPGHSKFQIGRNIYETNLCNYNKREASSDQRENNNYEEISYKKILQEEHIPEKDVTVPQACSSSDGLKPSDQGLYNIATDSQNNLFIQGDSVEFIDFMQTIPLTGDRDVDEEIVKFYRTKFIQK